MFQFLMIYWICLHIFTYTVLCLVAQSCLTFCHLMDCSPPGSSVHGDSPGKNTGVGCHVLLQGTFPTQGLNPGLPNCSQILYCLNHQGSPRILEWVVYPFSRGFSQLRNQTGVSCIAGGFFTSWATREALDFLTMNLIWYKYEVTNLFKKIYIYFILLCFINVSICYHSNHRVN